MGDKEQRSGGAGRVWRWLKWPFRVLFHLLGWSALLALLLAFTPAPWRLYAWLEARQYHLAGEPQYLVLMGGGGIPSESGLMRAYATAVAAAQHPRARVVVAMPGSLSDTNSSVMKMRDELLLRGIARTRLLFEDKGRHTREQAVNCYQLLQAARAQPAVLVVTSPEHVRRCLWSFQKAGFTNVAGRAAQDVPVEADLRFQTAELQGKHVPDVGESLTIRYTFWNNVALEVRCLRELSALLYYRWLGWI